MWWKRHKAIFRLFGYIEPLFGDENQIIEWRFAKYKDRYRIRPWIYYLIQLATKENALPPRIIAKDKDLTLKTIEKSTALEKLKMYVEAYLQASNKFSSFQRKYSEVIEKDESAVNFDAELHIEMLNEQNVLGSLMTAVTTCESNIQSIWTEELENNVLLVIIQVGARDIYHLENIMRKIKQITSVIRLKRNINEA